MSQEINTYEVLDIRNVNANTAKVAQKLVEHLQ